MPKHITITFEIENEEFQASLGNESLGYNRVLAGIARKIAAGEVGGGILDINGNSIGAWQISESKVQRAKR